MTRPTAGLPLTEAQWQEKVIGCAQWRRWRVFHVRDARKQNMVGWPDLTLIRPPRLVMLELKTATGTRTPEQIAVGELLVGCPGVEYAVARPGRLGPSRGDAAMTRTYIDVVDRAEPTERQR